MMYDSYFDGLSGFWEESRRYSENKPVGEEMCKLVTKFTSSPAFNNSLLITNIADISKLNSEDKLKFIRSYFYKITANVFSGYDIEEHRRLFLNTDFLLAFKQVLSEKISCGTIDATTLIQINNICYDLLTMPQNSKSKEIENIVFSIASEINASKTPYLLGIGLPRNLAVNLVMSRYSSFDENIIIRRINFLIITQRKEIFAKDPDDIDALTNTIKNIYSYLFMGNEKWVRVFQYFMMDVIPAYTDENWVTPNIEELDSIMNLAILSIIEEMPVQVIRAALVNYAQCYLLTYSNKPFRFSLNKLSGDYPRISSVVNTLRMNENIFVP